jgi:hypothetical protein
MSYNILNNGLSNMNWSGSSVRTSLDGASHKFYYSGIQTREKDNTVNKVDSQRSNFSPNDFMNGSRSDFQVPLGTPLGALSHKFYSGIQTPEKDISINKIDSQKSIFPLGDFKKSPLKSPDDLHDSWSTCTVFGSGSAQNLLSQHEIKSDLANDSPKSSTKGPDNLYNPWSSHPIFDLGSIYGRAPEDDKVENEILTPKEELKNLERQREECPVSKTAIELQAQLIKAKGEGKAWAETQVQIDRVGKKSVNRVYKLLELNSDRAMAYFKMGSDPKESEAVGILEKLMWDVAVVMGLEEMFVPTGLVKIFVKNGKEGLDGGIQPAQSGAVLNGSNASKIEKDDLLKAVVTTILFGMWDAHGDNIFISDAGKILFFDNSRSLPHSNGFICRYGSLTSAYRCALLDLEKSCEALSAIDLELIKVALEELQYRLLSLSEYLNSKYVKALTEKLPKNWFNANEALAAMENRIIQLQNAMLAKPPESMIDLVVGSNPDYRLAFALQLAYSYIAGNSTESIHDDLGYLSINKLTNYIVHKGYSVSDLQFIAENPDTSWNEMCLAISEEIKKGPFKMPRSLVNLKKERNLLMKEIYLRSNMDNKD